MIRPERILMKARKLDATLICLALAGIGGLLLSRLTKLLNLPAVTAYLVAGLLMGPFFLGALNITGVGFNTSEQVEDLSILSQTIIRHLGITLLPQAGVALGMVLTASSLPDGAIVRNVVMFAVLVYELVGPALTKRSLMLAGEIDPEGRTSARKHNQPKPPFHLG